MATKFLSKIELLKIKSPYLRLTLLYVAIVMIISVSFSFVIYRTSSGEIGRGLTRQANVLRNLGDEFLPPSFQPRDLDTIRTNQINESSVRLRNNLIMLNLLILVLSSAASYYLARLTLREIEDAAEAQKRFTADASHELRTPLTAMHSEIEVALRDKKMSLAEAKNLLQSNLEEISKLESLSNALLKLSKFKESEQTAFEELPLADILADAYSKIEKIADKKSIEFQNKAESVLVFGDRSGLVELFTILFENTIKYSPKNSKVKIATKKHHQFIEVTVSDQGVGIKESDLPYIFNRFYRADQSRSKEKSDGYGLGLSIAKAIVESQDGDISVKSTLGHGSSFTVKLHLA